LDLNLAGKKALITGAGKGIGRAIACRLAEEGCDLVLVGRTVADLEAVAAALRQKTVRTVQIMTADLADPKAVALIAQRHGDVDILINNAGNIPGGSLRDLSDQAWREGWGGKVFGYIDMMRAFLPKMESRRAGVILNIIGAAGERPTPEYAAGGSGNAALMALTRGLGGRSPDQGVRILGINPGPVLTERLERLLQQRAKGRFGDSNRWPEMLHAMPFGRAATCDEIADMAAFLVSDRSAYTSGVIVTIDGGLGARGTWG
jgi:NAD(P)-dependent dehydrogenase (short-subunit alcohol dehydrogenase family)